MSLKTSIEKTIKYAKKYDFKPTLEELKERLISPINFNDNEISDFFHKNKEYKNLVNIKNKNRCIKDKTEKTKKLARLIEKKFKNILFLGVTGSVAANGAKENDDIDLMIITKKNTLWTTRLKLRWFIYSHKIAHRKYGNKQKKDEFCFNMWLDENRFELPKTKRNLRSAIDMILVKPIINKDETYEKFLLANHWAKKWVATGYNKRIKLSVHQQARDISLPAGRHGLKKGDFFRFCLNLLVFVPQYLWMLPKISNENVGLTRAFFHRN